MRMTHAPLFDFLPRREFWSSNGYFGMGASDVIFFAQGTLPCFGLDGKLLLETPGTANTHVYII